MPNVLTHLQLSKDAQRSGHIEKAWAHLSAAHILSQPQPWSHLCVHWKMLLLAIHTRDLKETFGQLLRLILAAPGSFTGKYPKGNTGRSNVSMFLPMQIPKHLLDQLPHSAASDRD